MATVIKERRAGVSKLPDVLFGILPQRLLLELERTLSCGTVIEEIRIRTGRVSHVTSHGRNIALSYVPEREQVESMVTRICDGSLYAHAHTISEGYVTLEGGVRVGIVGRAAMDGGRIIGVYDISGLCFRLPVRINGVGERVCRLLGELGAEGGVLVYSPPGEGKTTLLRNVAAAMASGSDAKRVVVVDGRGELGFSLDGKELSVDILSGYPKAKGIEIAARSMNAQLIVCDEIGDEAEVKAMIGAQNCGVPLLASAHASSVEGLLRRSGIAALHRAAVFGAYVGISRSYTQRDYVYTVTYREEAGGYF